MDNAEPVPVDPVPPVDTDPVQTLAEDLLTKPPKKQRLLSERQKEALRKGREIRWMKKQSAGEEEPPPATLDNDHTRTDHMSRPLDPHLQALLDPNTSSSESDSDSSSLDDDNGSKKKRKAKKLKKSIPKAVRRRLDRYLKSKMEDVKVAAQRERDARYRDDDLPPMPPHNPVLQRHPERLYNKNALVDYPLSFV